MRHRFLTLAWLPLLAVPFLPGCTTAVVSLAPRQTLPPSLWQCQAQPAPIPDDADDATFFSWVAATWVAGESCRSALAIAHTAVEGGANARP